MKKTLILLLLATTVHKPSITKTLRPQAIVAKSMIPNKSTALKIAEAIWLPIYGKQILKEKPYQAYLVKDSVWVINSTISHPKNAVILGGGEAYLEIQKSDCKVLKQYRMK